MGQLTYFRGDKTFDHCDKRVDFEMKHGIIFMGKLIITMGQWIKK